MKLVAVVLAAGASSRMGQVKALLDFAGKTCVERVLEACREGGADAAVMVTSPAGEPVRARAALAGLPVIEAVNPRPERGMLSSLQCGLRVLPAGADAFLLFPVDYPIVPGAEVARLKAAYQAGGLTRIWIPWFAGRRGHPILVDAALAAEFLALGEEDTARTVIQAHANAIAHVPAADDRVLMDMDTPEDYRRCEERFLRALAAH